MIKTSLGHLADRLGFRRAVAYAANVAYRDRTFSVDQAGRWINRQAECTLVSTTIHTSPFQVLRDVVLGNWCYAYQPEKGDIVVDVGAGIGEDAVVFSLLVGDAGRVVAIEAHPGTAECLRLSVERSGLSNVECLPIAIGDTDGVVGIDDTDLHLGNSIMGAGEIEVDMMSIDSLCERHQIERIDLLKMNIEGAEKLAVQGMTAMAPYIRNIVISCHDFVADQGGGEEFRSKSAVMSALQELGFVIRTRPRVENEPWVEDYLYASR